MGLLAHVFVLGACLGLPVQYYALLGFPNFSWDFLGLMGLPGFSWTLLGPLFLCPQG